MSGWRRGALIGASIGTIVPLAVMWLSPDLPFNELLWIWPSSIFGFSDMGNDDRGFTLLVIFLEFAGNALYYGLAGFLIGMGFDKVRDWRLKDETWTFRG